MTQRTIDCPVCGREVGVPPHTASRKWIPQQDWLIRKLCAVGVTHKGIARIFGTTKKVVSQRIYYLDHRP